MGSSDRIIADRKYLNGEISKERKALEERMLNGDLMDRVRVR